MNPTISQTIDCGLRVGGVAGIRKVARPGESAGWWLLPGGKAEFGEDLEHTARREATEEAGCSIELLRPTGAGCEVGHGRRHLGHPNDAANRRQPARGAFTGPESITLRHHQPSGSAPIRWAPASTATCRAVLEERLPDAAA